MKKFIKPLLILLIAIVSACGQEKKTNNDLAVNETTVLKVDKEKQEEIINEHLKNGAWKHETYSREWQEEIDKGLAKDNSVAYLWQQKAMPMFKQGKHELGLKYIDNAVKYDRQKWQDYRAFMKCIFVKDYRGAIADFNDYEKRFGYGYVMDHTFRFYKGVSYLQLNEFEKAEQIFKEDYQRQLKEHGKDNLHHLDLFYYGISRFEQKNYEGAIEMFDKSLEIYPNFSDVQCFKAGCLYKLGRIEEGDELTKKCQENGKKGNTINEDNIKYENYPYQIRWWK
jgi:tetratricopeptide (TPR) repeat protein